MTIEKCKSRLSLFKILLVLFAFLFSASHMHANRANEGSENVSKQDVELSVLDIITVAGNVIDATNNESMIGVSITEKGTQNGTITNIDGRFTMKVNQGSTLVVSFIGYKSQELVVTSGTQSLSIIMEEDVQMLGEVVTIGYGSARKEDLSMAISTVKVDQAMKSQTANIGNLIQGRMPGVTYRSAGGDPMREDAITIRGTGSRHGDAVLVVVDGVPGAPYNVEDIENITVLKDAASAAIYGASAGSGGVVIITTKRPETGRLKVDFNISNGFKRATNLPKTLTAEEYNMVYKKAADLNGTELSNINNPEVFPWGNVTRTDWVDEIFRTAHIQHYGMSIYGGSELVKTYASVSYDKEEGTMLNTWSQKIGAKLNVDMQLTKWLKLSERVSFEYKKGQGGVNESHEGPFIEAVYFPRSATVYEFDESGNPVYDDLSGKQKYGGIYPEWAKGKVSGYANARNPVAELKRRRQDRPISYIHSTTSLEAKPIYKLTVKSDFSAGKRDERREEFLPRYLETGRQQKDNSKSILTQMDTEWLWESTATYVDNFADKHDLSLMGGYSMKYDKFKMNNIKAYGFSSEDENSILLPGAGDKGKTEFDENIASRTLISGFARLAYSFDDRYFLISSVRRDASSRLARGKKGDTFWAASGAWKLSSEPFFKSLDLSFVNLIKFRGGWGQTGNLSALPKDESERPRMVSSKDYIAIGDGGKNDVLGFYPETKPNPDKRWERTETLTVGVDFTLLDRSLDVSVDYFSKKTKNLLEYMPLSVTSGYDQEPWGNIGNVTNKGWEFNVNYNRKFGDLSVDFFSNLSTVKNEVKNIGVRPFISHDKDYTYFGLSPLRSSVGQPWFAYYVYDVVGVFKNEEEINSYIYKDPITGATSKLQPDAQPGDFIYRDADNNGVINDNDRVYKGSYLPKYTYAFGANFEYKGVDLSIMFQGVGGNKIYNVFRQNGVFGQNGNNMLKETLDSWSFNPESNFPRLGLLTSGAGGGVNYNRVNSFFLESGSYLRLKNIVVGYTLPKPLMKNIGLPSSSLRFYVSGENLATITPYKGTDPEVDQSLNGIDASTYPLARIFTFGLNLSF